MIIDTHTHVHPDKDGLGRERDASVAAYLKAFDESPLDRAVLLPIEPIMPNAFVREAAAQRPGRLFCYGSVEPMHEGAVDLAASLLADPEVYGLKFHPRRQGFGIEAVPMLKQIAAHAAEAGKPIIVDSMPYGRGALQDPTLDMIAAMSEASPSVKLIIAHMGGHRILDALILARTTYSIYLDLSLILQVYRGSHIEQDIFYAIRRIGADRCLFGSDYPDVPLEEAYTEMREALDQHGFSSAEQDMIFGRNAMKLLGIS